MPRPPDLSRIPLQDLTGEVRVRQRRRSALERQRATLLTKLRELDAAIRDLNSPMVIGGGSGQRPVGRTLREYLARVLDGKTMSVSEAAEAVERMGYETIASDFRTTVNAALVQKGNGFKRVERGRYTLAKSKG